MHRLALRYGYQDERLCMRGESRSSNFLLTCAFENNRHNGLLGLPCKMVPNDMSICFYNTDSFEFDHFDQYVHLIFWLRVNDYTGEFAYDGPLYDGFLHMMDDMLGSSQMHIKYSSYIYDGFCI